jgi:hypothetical protein
MLWLTHRQAAHDFDARFVQYELRSPEFVVYRIRLENGAFDETFEPPASRGNDWSRLAVVLAGEVLAYPRGAPVLLGPGSLLIAPRWNDGRLRHLTTTSDVLFIAWRAPGPVGPPPPEGAIARLPASTRAAVADLAGALAGSDARAVHDGAASTRSALRSLGLSLDEEAVLAAARTIEPWHARFGAALEAVLFPLSGKPMAVDLGNQLGLGGRQVVRLANEYFARFHVSVETWSEYVRGMRFSLGLFFASHPSARTESLSRALGFSSPTALCHAFQAAGLPSPQTVRRELAGLAARRPPVPSELADIPAW